MATVLRENVLLSLPSLREFELTPQLFILQSAMKSLDGDNNNNNNKQNENNNLKTDQGLIKDYTDILKTLNIDKHTLPAFTLKLVEAAKNDIDIAENGKSISWLGSIKFPAGSSDHKENDEDNYNVLVWVPEVLFSEKVKHLTCPNCVDNKSNNNQPSTVKAIGWDGLGETCWYILEEPNKLTKGKILISRQYHCSSCNCFFRGWHPKCVEKMDQSVGLLYPIEKDKYRERLSEIRISQIVKTDVLQPQHFYMTQTHPEKPIDFEKQQKQQPILASKQQEQHSSSNNNNNSNSSSNLLLPVKVQERGDFSDVEHLKHSLTTTATTTSFQNNGVPNLSQQQFSVQPNHQVSTLQQPISLNPQSNPQTQFQFRIATNLTQQQQQQHGFQQPMFLQFHPNHVLQPQFQFSGQGQPFPQHLFLQQQQQPPHSHYQFHPQTAVGLSSHPSLQLLPNPSAAHRLRHAASSSSVESSGNSSGGGNQSHDHNAVQSSRSIQFCSVCFGIRRQKGQLLNGHKADGYCPVKRRKATADEKRELRRRRQKLRRAASKSNSDLVVNPRMLEDC